MGRIQKVKRKRSMIFLFLALGGILVELGFLKGLGESVNLAIVVFYLLKYPIMYLKFAYY